MLDLSLSSKNKVWVFVILTFILLFVVLFPYIKTEIYTATYSLNMNPQELCTKDVEILQTNTKLNYIKVVELDNDRKTAKIFCIFNNPDQNVSIEIEQNIAGTWKVVISKKLNKDSNIYYPFYI